MTIKHEFKVAIKKNISGDSIKVTVMPNDEVKDLLSKVIVGNKSKNISIPSYNGSIDVKRPLVKSWFASEIDNNCYFSAFVMDDAINGDGYTLELSNSQLEEFDMAVNSLLTSIIPKLLKITQETKEFSITITEK